MLKILTEDECFEMANLPPRRTNLPYTIWIDGRGENRKLQHKIPRIKVNIKDDIYIPVSIEKEPRILIKNIKTFRGFPEVKKFIQKTYNILMKHWNQEIDDGDAIFAIVKVCKENKSEEQALKEVEEMFK